jgi:RecA/RadA recombinase
MAKEKPSQKAIADVMNNFVVGINKAYGAPVMSIAEDIELERVQTGIFSIDYATQGGIPRGRWFVAVGKESVFKSTLLYKIAGKTQRVCGNCLSGYVKENYDTKVITVKLDDTGFIKKTKKGLVSKKYLANIRGNTIYIPDQPIVHKKDFKAVVYDIECSNCDDPDYSIFLLIDSEKNYTNSWGIRQGIVIARMAHAKTRYTEQVGEIAKEVLSTGRCTIVGVDSVPATPPKGEDIISFADEPRMGMQPKLWNRIVRILTSMLNNTFTYVYNKDGKEVVEVRRPEPMLGMIQQWREKIGGYGRPETMTAGWGLKYASSMSLELTLGEREYIGDKTDKNIRGIWFNFMLIKSKTSKPFAHGRFFFNLDTLSVDNNISIVDKAIETGIIKSSGSWFYVGEEKYQGKLKLIEGIKKKIPAIGRKLIELNAAT